ncbi:MAG: aldose 1-epimerase family protein [Bifidobacterium psychraerophilum]|jgi:aldose 1-epimerase|uniref:aldose 1-epimerase family protein n=1 Tax=Bifidobacterium psychraerophilum TaxID=218140 RepID=UPI0039EBEB20
MTLNANNASPSKAHSNTPRTGQQYSIRYGDYSAVITELGATLRRLDFRDKNIVVPFDDNEVVPCCNGYVLVPYPNRLEDGAYDFDGEHYQLPIDEASRQTALHGDGYRHMWVLESLTESSVTLSWRVPGIIGYPFDVIVTVTYALGAEGLTMTTVAYNNDTKPAPWAFGIHPWLSNGSQATDPDDIEAANALCKLTLPCDSHVTASPDRLLPTGVEPVEGSVYDLRGNPSLEGRPFDDAWTSPIRDHDGNTTAVFTRPDGLQISLTGDDTINAWQVCTATGFPEGHHPSGVAVEPMTAYANALRSGKNLVSIEAGASYGTTIHYQARQY